jgi:hypothetical protein
VTHPYLIDPERAAAFAFLSANPSGSRARWAKGLTWSPSKVQRFIEALLRFRLAEIEVNPYFTHFKPLVDVEPPKPSPVSDRSAPGQQPIKNRSTAGQAHLEALDSGFLVSRYAKAPPKNGGNAEAMTCIAVVNEVLGANFGEHYTPISHDNHGSHRAVQHWIEVGIPLETMTRLLRMKAAVFNPEKINGDMPRSLAFFTKWILKEWAIEQRQLPLVFLTVDRAPAQREKLKKPVALGSVVDATMLDVAAQLGVKR